MALSAYLCCSWFILIAQLADNIYVLTVALGLALCNWACYCWILSTSHPHVRVFYATVGTLCASLTLLCRPQLFLVCIVGLVLFIDAMRERDNRNPRMAIVFVPIVLVMMATFWYNAIRFGSPLDFGANYNLTSNDMTHRGFSLLRVLASLYAYFIEPLALQFTVPFLTNFEMRLTGVQLVVERMPGGYMWATPISLVLLANTYDKEHPERRSLMWICNMAIIASVVMAGFDGEGAGILARYFADFGWLLGICAMVGCLNICDCARTDSSALVVRIQRVPCVLVAISFAIQLFWTFFANYRI